MPNPKNFSNQNDWMDACMHQVRKVEGKPQDQAVVQCLEMWRNKDKKKKSAAQLLREIASSIEDKEAFSLFKKPGESSEVSSEFKDIFKANKASVGLVKGGKSEERLGTTETPPDKVQEYFVKGTDGNWYLQDADHVHVEEGPVGIFKVFRSYKDPGTEVPGLTVLTGSA